MSAASDFFVTGAKPWVSDKTYKQWAYVISPLDGEEYCRIAAKGSGTTDPADDLTNYVARSYERTLSLGSGALLANSATAVLATTGRGATQTALPAIGVSARTSILSITGRGCIDYFVFLKAVTGTTRIEIICDGRTVYDQENTYTTNSTLCAIGQPSSYDNTIPFRDMAVDPKGIEFRRTLQVYLTNTATASTTTAGIAYHLRSRA